MSDRKPQPLRVVLVEPADNLNIGAVARAMMNFGYADLALVRPVKFRAKKAAVTACWADGLVRRAQIVDSLEECVSDFERVAAFSARDGKNRPATFLLPEWGDALRSEAAMKTALVFGPEDSGLRQEHLEQCSELVRIPSSAEFPSFNLAQAVILALYEVVRQPVKSLRRAQALPSARDLKQLDKMLVETMRATGFAHKSAPPGIPPMLALMVRRALPNKRELQTFLGFLAKVKQGFER